MLATPCFRRVASCAKSPHGIAPSIAASPASSSFQKMEGKSIASGYTRGTESPNVVETIRCKKFCWRRVPLSLLSRLAKRLPMLFKITHPDMDEALSRMVIGSTPSTVIGTSFSPYPQRSSLVGSSGTVGPTAGSTRSSSRGSTSNSTSSSSAGSLSLPMSAACTSNSSSSGRASCPSSVDSATVLSSSSSPAPTASSPSPSISA